MLSKFHELWEISATLYRFWWILENFVKFREKNHQNQNENIWKRQISTKIGKILRIFFFDDAKALKNRKNRKKDLFKVDFLSLKSDFSSYWDFGNLLSFCKNDAEFREKWPWSFPILSGKKPYTVFFFGTKNGETQAKFWRNSAKFYENSGKIGKLKIRKFAPKKCNFYYISIQNFAALRAETQNFSETQQIFPKLSQKYAKNSKIRKIGIKAASTFCQKKHCEWNSHAKFHLSRTSPYGRALNPFFAT